MCGHSVLLLVANNELKDALTHIVDGHQRVINGRYDVMAGTTGTLEVVQKRFPTKQFIDLGHGPEFGDIWAIVFMLEHLASGSLRWPAIQEAVNAINPKRYDFPFVLPYSF